MQSALQHNTVLLILSQGGWHRAPKREERSSCYAVAIYMPSLLCVCVCCNQYLQEAGGVQDASSAEGLVQGWFLCYLQFWRVGPTMEKLVRAPGFLALFVSSLPPCQDPSSSARAAAQLVSFVECTIACQP